VSQLAAAIAALAAPDNTYLSIQPDPGSDWYVEVGLPDPCTAGVFDGPYEIRFDNAQATPAKRTVIGDDPTAIAGDVLAWVQTMISSRP
jgi:hypothetical protein